MGKEENQTPKLTVIDKRKLQPESDPNELKEEEKITKVGFNEAYDKPKKKTLTEQLAERKTKKQATKQERSNKIGCPNCKYMGIRDKFLFNPQLHAMICPACGVFFMEARLRQKVMEDIKRKQESGIIVPK